MKKIKLFVCLVLLLVGCQPQPQTQPQKEEIKNTVSCHFIGDLLYEKPYYDWIEDDSQDKGYYDLVRPYLQNDDLSIANLETPIGGKELNISGTGYSFNASREIGKQVASLDLEVVSTANNHANDRGNQGIDNTLDFLKEKDILAVGTYYNQDDRDQGKYMTIHGIKFGFVSYTYATNQIVSDENQAKVALFNRPSDRKMTQAYKDLLTKEVTQTRENCDILIAMMHWGTEFTYEISKQQEDVSKLLSDLGVDIIIGNHPHCSQTMEWINNKTLCMYSLGNFVSADPIVDRTHQEFKNAYNVSMMVSLDIVKENHQFSIQNIDYIPIINYYDQNLENFKLIPYDQYTSQYETTHYHYQNGLTKKWIEETYQQLIPQSLSDHVLQKTA
ncbi:CapA family protein [Massilimicrobiota sp. An134]|uniref:CapA family protein n=1 Tax=Massilimicrobiota sp. An134 TaxID=1965557 RepID=UPI000B3A8CF8|nr:CapA family protein [Massilimicrobiota sp. An134]OUQ28761.1 capsule biosynthesis protein capA [Massilimicrobiota sp. An134]